MVGKSFKNFQKIFLYEIGAGKGYWAYFINKEGGNIKCFDNSDCISNYFINKETFYPVKFCTPIGVVEECKNANVLMFCWPEYDKNWAYEYLKTIKPSKLIYVGEEYGGCCANDNFFKFISKLMSYTPSYPGGTGPSAA